MKIEFKASFERSIEKIVDTTKWWCWEYWVDKYYDVKWNVWALKKYFNIARKMRPWDHAYVIQMTAFQLELLKKSIEIGNECSKGRILKVEKINRFLELAKHYEADDYAERCGYVYVGFDFVPTDETKDKPKKDRSYRMVSKCSDEIEENNRKAIIAAYELENAEWNEMWDIIKGIPAENWNEDHTYNYGNGTDARSWWT
jgi:hypothetical protein